MRLPSKKTSPLVGSRNPPIILSVVVLPQPDGPRKVTNSLSLISRLIFFRIRSPSSKTTSMSFRFTIFSIIPRPFRKNKVSGLCQSAKVTQQSITVLIISLLCGKVNEMRVIFCKMLYIFAGSPSPHTSRIQKAPRHICTKGQTAYSPQYHFIL